MLRVFRLGVERGACQRRGLTSYARLVKRGVALLVAAALLNLSTTALVASPRPAAASGEVTVAGALMVEGAPAVPGQTFFSGTSFATPAGSLSQLSLSNLARVEMSGGTKLKLDFSPALVSGALEEGGARFFVPAGVSASVAVAGASVLTDTSEAASFSVHAGPQGFTVSVLLGWVETRVGGGVRTLAAGEVFSASRGGAPLPGHGQNLSEGKRAGLIAGILAAVVAIIFAVARDGDDVEPPPCEGRPIILSGQVDSPC
jgi:ferric-dicitrate binding protein FerR (iron transport regulator)